MVVTKSQMILLWFNTAAIWGIPHVIIITSSLTSCIAGKLGFGVLWNLSYAEHTIMEFTLSFKKELSLIQGSIIADLGPR